MARDLAFDINVAGTDAKAAAPARVSLFQRIADALTASRTRRAQSEVERYIAMHGGVLTDDLERAISRRFGRTVGM